MSASEPTNAGRHVIALIILGLGVWGLYHAFGAATQFSDTGTNPWRGVVVGLFFLGFVGFWLLMLRIRSGRAGKDGRGSSR